VINKRNIKSSGVTATTAVGTPIIEGIRKR